MCRALQLCACGLGVLLLAGCGSPGHTRLQSPKAGAPSKIEGTQRGSKLPLRRANPFSDRSGSRSEDRIARAHALYASAVIQELNGEEEEALRNYLLAAQDDPGSEWLALEVSRRLIQQRKLDEALQLLQRSAAEPDVTGPVLARLGLVYSQLGKHELALETSRAAVRKSPSELASYQALFFNYLHARQPAAAARVLEEASKVSNVSAEFLAGLAELYGSYALQNPSERDQIRVKALKVLQRARKLPSREPGLKLKLADGFATFGDPQTAAQLYHELLKLELDIPALREGVHAKLADIYLRGSDRKRATEQLEALIAEDPTNPQPYYFLGQLAMDDKKLEQAADHFSKAILLRPDFDQAYYELANVQLALDQPREALATLEKAREKFRVNYFIEFGSGIACVRLKEFDRALQYFTAAEIVANASSPERLNHFFYFQLGVAYEQKGDYAEAARAFEKCLALSPDFDEAMNYLGYMWTDRGENLDKALALLEKAVKKDPENAAYLDSLGWVYFKLNRLPEALENIQKAVKLSEEPDATLHDHLGDIYQAMGEASKAREAWSEALKIEPSESIRQKLEPQAGAAVK